MRPHHTQTGNVPMLHPIRGVLLHLRKHIAYDPRVVIGRLLRTGDVDCDVGELGPGEGVVEVVFHEIAAAVSEDDGMVVGGGRTSRADW